MRWTSIHIYPSSSPLYVRRRICFIKPAVIGVIYRDTRGNGTLHFWTEGYRTPTFQDEKVRNLLSSAVNRDDLRRLNDYKPFSAGAICSGLRWESSRRRMRRELLLLLLLLLYFIIHCRSLGRFLVRGYLIGSSHSPHLTSGFKGAS